MSLPVIARLCDELQKRHPIMPFNAACRKVIGYWKATAHEKIELTISLLGPALFELRFRGIKVGEWQRLRQDSDGRGQLQWERLSDIKGQLDEECRPAGFWRLDLRNECPVFQILQRLALICFANRQHTEIAGLRIGRPP